MFYNSKNKNGNLHCKAISVWLVFISLCLNNNLFGQIHLFYEDKGKRADTSEIGPMFRAAIELEKQLEAKALKIGRLDLLEIGDQVYAVARGRLDVYKWESGEWKNLYKGVLFGHNFYSKNFVFQNQIYSFGGYGFWNAHGQVIKFSFKEGDWELVPCTKDLKYSLAYKVPEGLQLLGNESIIIDLPNRSIEHYEPVFSGEWFKNRCNQKDIEFERYIYFPHDRPILIFDKQTHQLYESDLSMMASSYFNPQRLAFFHIMGDRLSVYNQSMDTVENYHIEQELREKYLPVSASRFPLNNKLKIAGLWVLILIILIIVVSIIKRSRTKSSVHHKTVIQQILNWNDFQISMSDLDVLLNIHHIQNPDTLKFKRYQKIQEINRIYQSTHQKMLIIRKKDTADKRRYIYEIDK